MGIIAAVTPSLKSTRIIQRMQDVSLADLVKLAEIEFQKLIPRQKPKAYFKVLPEVTPSDESQVDCLGYVHGILSTINFVCSLAKIYSMTPILTFDQPLFWKAIELQASFISNNNIHNCVLRLGGFHMCMSFLGAIGRLMQGSGISSVFERIYAELSDGTILSGKEMSRGTKVDILFMEH